MSNPFFTNNNWLLITDIPVLGKSTGDFKPANPDSPYSVWGIPRDGVVYDELISVFGASVKSSIEKEEKLDDQPFSSEEQRELLRNLKVKIDYYLANRPEPISGYELEIQGIRILIDIRNNAFWDRPLSTMIRLYDIVFRASETKGTIYLNLD